MAGIVWLASYPKSGNTWARVFIQNYQNPARLADINDLAVGHAAQHALFDLFGAVEASDLGDDELQALRPALYRTIASAIGAPLFLKVHDAFSTTADGVPLFPPDATRAVVYIIRNPGDVAVSLARHFGSSLGEAVSMLCREDTAVRDWAGQCRQHLRSWSGHVKSWMEESALRASAVRYEDLLADPVRGFTALLATAGLVIDPDRLLGAIEHSGFERLRSQERAAGFTERHPKATSPFFHTGRSGDWRDHLAPDLMRRLVDAHGEVMRRFGYLTPAGEPVF
jgi:hypothetical protein